MTTEGPGPAISPRTRARALHILDHYWWCQTNANQSSLIGLHL